MIATLSLPARLRRMRALGGVALMLVIAPVQAVQRDWINIHGGLFGDAANWSPLGGPRDGDFLLFKLGVPAATRYAVSNVKGEFDRLVVVGDALTFDFNTVNILVLGNANVATPGLVIGQGSAGAIADVIFARAGRVVAHDAVLADDADVTGNLTVQGTTLDLSNDLVVGRRGSATLSLDGGAQLTVAGDGLLGEAVGAHGNVQLSGNGTRWRNTGDIAVGFDGTAAVSVLAGAEVFGDNNSLLGHRIGSSGALTVRGAGSSWTTGDMHIGYAGSGSLSLDSGARLISRFGLLGTQAGAQGSAVIDGTATLWSTDTLLVGYAGQGTLSVSNGATLSNRFGYIGDQMNGNGLVTVSGPQTLWSNSEFLHIGQRSSGTLHIREGGTVSAKAASLGWLLGSSATVTIDGDDSLFDVTQLLEIAAARDSALRVGNGGRLHSGSAQLGIAALASGAVELDGVGASWTNDGNLIVGEAGTGTIGVRGGAQLDVGFNAQLGNQLGGRGVITVEDVDSQWINSADIAIGFRGEGLAMVRRGGTVDAQHNTLLGHQRGSFGELLLSDAGSRWTTNEFHVGYLGNGTALIRNGAVLDSTYAYIGEGVATDARVTVEGAGATLHAGVAMVIGDAGTGALDILAGGAVASDGLSVVGRSTGGVGTVLVDGAGSLWSTDVLQLGHLGQATLDIAQGGMVSVKHLTGGSTGTIGLDGGTLRVRASGTTVNTIDLKVGGGTIEVLEALDTFAVSTALGGSGGLIKSGAGTLLLTGSNNDVDDTIIRGGMLRLANGGSINTDAGTIADLAGVNASLQISGPTSAWHGAGELVVAESGNGSLSIDAGAQLFSEGGFLAREVGARAEAGVSGAGSQWINSGSLYVGFRGIGTLTIEQGARVTNTYGWVGGFATGFTQGSEVIVRDLGSSWQSTEDLEVGVFGLGRVTVTDAGVTVGRDLRVGVSVLSDGVVAVSGRDASLTVGRDLLIGEYMGKGQLHLAEGARLNSTGNAIIGADVTGQGAMRIDSFAKWTSSADIAVGYFNTGTVQVSGGGQVVGNHNTIVGHQASGNGSLFIAGAGSSWLTNDLHVGYDGVGQLELSSGAWLFNSLSALGTHRDSRGTATVRGIGSEWLSARLVVGVDSVGTLTVEDGAAVISTDGELGRAATGAGTALVRGAGSTWRNSQNLSVGGAGQGLLTIENGGLVENFGASLADGIGSSGKVTVSAARWVNRSGLNLGLRGRGTLTVSDAGYVSDSVAVVGNLQGAAGLARVRGANSVWTTSGMLFVGYSGQGRVEVAQGAVVTSAGGALGMDATGVGNVVIDGAGSQWQIAGELSLGLVGRGTVDLQHGGGLRVGSTLFLGPQGTLNLSDGTLDAHTLAIFGGAFNFSGGRLQVTRIDGALVNQGGTLAPGHSPGRTEVTGDYTQGAAGTLEIELASDTRFDVLSVSGAAHLDGTLAIKLGEDFDPLLGSHFDFLFAGQGIVGAFAQVVAPTWNGKRLLLDTGTDKLLRLTVAAVPLPSAAWLLAGAVVLLGGRARRRAQPRSVHSGS